MATSPSARSDTPTTPSEPATAAAPAAETRSLTIMFAPALVAFIAIFNETFLDVGFFIRRFATKPLFLTTVSTWIIGGIITATAPSFAALLIGRVIQSVGTGLLVPIAMKITLTVAPRPKLGTFLGLMGAMTTLGPSVAILA